MTTADYEPKLLVTKLCTFAVYLQLHVSPQCTADFNFNFLFLIFLSLFSLIPIKVLPDYFTPLFQCRACAADVITFWFYIYVSVVSLQQACSWSIHVYCFCFCLFSGCLFGRTQYELSLVATDSVNEATTKVVIHIADVNDRPPEFDRSKYEATIEEERSDGLPIRLLKVDIFGRTDRERDNEERRLFDFKNYIYKCIMYLCSVDWTLFVSLCN